MSEVLARRDRALTPEETEQLLRDRLEGAVQGTLQEFGIFTVWIAPDSWVDAATLCRDEPRLAYDMFDCLLGVDAREDGFDVVAVLYSTTTGNRIVLRTRCAGGREAPVCPSLTAVYRGADWMERETYDMFSIDFPGHPSVEPRLLTVENFEGWPLRKDFYLASRVVKPWPGVAEPKELDEHGNVIEREVRMGDAPGPYDVDKAIAEQARLANPVPEPQTEDAQNVDELAADAESAGDSGRVLTGEQEQEAEEAEAQASDVNAEVAGERAGDDEQIARTKAEQRRKEQAEARARKAAERAEAAEAPGGDAEDAADESDQHGDGQEGA